MIEIDNLTREQITALEQQIAAKKQAEKDRIAQERANYKDLVSKTVREQIIDLQTVSNLLSLTKAQIFGSFASLVELKNELYGVKSGQQSHTFTDEAGNSITIGFRVIDRFDDTLDMGIACVREYINSLAIDENTSKLVDMINNLLKKDAKGNLKPNRILDLQNLADEIKSESFYKGVEIIRTSYKPIRSALFVEAEVLDAIGTKQSVALSITSADFPEGFTPNFEVFK